MLESLEGRMTIPLKEAADVLGISVSHAYRAAHAGDIPVLHIGARLVVPTTPLLEMLGVRDHPREEQRDAAEVAAA